MDVRKGLAIQWGDVLIVSRALVYKTAGGFVCVAA